MGSSGISGMQVTLQFRRHADRRSGRGLRRGLPALLGGRARAARAVARAGDRAVVPRPLPAPGRPGRGAGLRPARARRGAPRRQHALVARAHRRPCRAARGAAGRTPGGRCVAPDDAAAERLACAVVTTASYGSWPTPFTSASVVAGAVRLGELVLDGDDVLWAEGRPAEGGRNQIVRRRPDGTRTDLLPGEMNARTAVHEYGGGGWWARDGVVWFANWADQRLYRLADGEPVPLTPEPASPRADRFADGDLAPDGATIVCVRERHHGPSAAEVVNEIVRLDAHTPGEPEVLVS